MLRERKLWQLAIVCNYFVRPLLDTEASHPHCLPEAVGRGPTHAFHTAGRLMEANCQVGFIEISLAAYKMETYRTPPLFFFFFFCNRGLCAAVPIWMASRCSAQRLRRVTRWVSICLKSIAEDTRFKIGCSAECCGDLA